VRLITKEKKMKRLTYTQKMDDKLSRAIEDIENVIAEANERGASTGTMKQDLGKILSKKYELRNNARRV
tara:strand:+ start:613 stop:819 length:207 start_codon:yes stop_codon:yes gene_type:complete